MPEVKKWSTSSTTVRLIAATALFIFVVAGVAWWRLIETNPNHVFWAMVNNSLSTTSVTRHNSQTAQDRSVDQYIREQFGVTTAIASQVTLKQKAIDGESVIKSETIGTPDNDFSRYISISTPQKSKSGKPLDTRKVVGVWGKSDNAKGDQAASPQYFRQSILTIIPYGNFSSQQRKTLINQMRSHNIYNFSSSSVKSTTLNTKPVFVYQLKVKPSAYVDLMKNYIKLMGIGDIGLDPSAYADSPDITVEVTVDKHSKQIIKVNYPSSNQSEVVVDQNLDNPIILPKDTVPISELQDRIQKITL